MTRLVFPVIVETRIRRKFASPLGTSTSHRAPRPSRASDRLILIIIEDVGIALINNRCGG